MTKEPASNQPAELTPNQGVTCRAFWPAHIYIRDVTHEDAPDAQRGGGWDRLGGQALDKPLDHDTEHMANGPVYPGDPPALAKANAASTASRANRRKGTSQPKPEGAIVPKYAVTLVTTASTVIEVEAEDESAAIDLAFQNAQSASWDWPDIGDWALPSEMYPDVNNSSDDIQLLDD